MRRLVVGMAIITLAGMALSWAVADDKEIAKQITERLKAPDRQTVAILPSDVTPAEQESRSASDSRITQQIARKLQHQRSLGNLKEFRIRVSVEDGIVALIGHISDRKQGEMALDIARKTEGVREAIDHLIVVEKQPLPQPHGDDESDSQMAVIDAAVDKEKNADEEKKPTRDAAIARQIAGELKRQKEIGKLKGFMIDLSVKNGVATFDGRVYSEEQRQLAIDTAKNMEGIRGVVNNLAVQQQPSLEKQPETAAPDKSRLAKDSDATADKKVINDAAIARQIAGELKRQKEIGKLRGFTIDLSVKNGVATLDGRVCSEEQRKLAVDTAKNTEGIRGFVNNLAVQQQPLLQEQPEVAAPDEPRVAKDSDAPADEKMMNDAEIAQQIAAMLTRQKELGGLTGFSIDVAVENSVVLFEGHVSSAEQLDLAMAIARHTSGVRDVVSHLAINEPTPAEPAGFVANAVYRPDEQVTPEPGQLRQDQQIGEELMQRLHEAKRQGNLGGFGIAVSVSGACVHLGGRVSSPEQQQLALDIARYVPGVREVVNELTVAEAPIPRLERPAAQMIAQELGQRLQAEEEQGSLRDCDFDVKVDGGDVWLNGEVASTNQEQLAVETAFRIAGVQRVVSALKVAASPSVANEEPVPPANPALDPSAVPEAALANAAISARKTPIDAGPASGAAASRQPPVGPLARMPISPGVPSAEIERSIPVASMPQAALQADIGLVAMGHGPEARLTPLAATAVHGSQAAPAALLSSHAGPVASGQTVQTVVRPPTVQPVPIPAAAPVVYSMPGYAMYPAVQPPAGYYAVANQTPRPLGAARMAAYAGAAAVAAPILAIGQAAGAMPPHLPGPGHAVVPARYDHPSLPGYAWPTYGAHPNYGAVTYPKQYSPTAWPYIGPFYPYPQVPLGWRRVVLKWDDGWWQLNFKSK